MTMWSASRRLLVICTSALLLGCPGDDVPFAESGNDSSGSGGATTGSTGSATTNASATTMVMTGSASADTTMGPPDTSSTGVDPDTGSTTDEPETDSTMSGGGSESSSDDGGSSSSGAMVMEGYGDCALDPGQCLMDEVCGADDAFSPTFTVCIELDCMDVGECPDPPPGGTAMPACADITGDMVDDCYLDCSMGEDCPTGMDCLGGAICVWPAPPPGYGDCVADPTVCLMDESCYTDDMMMPTFGVCGDLDCMDVTECPLPPPGGMVGRACGDITGDGVDDCYLDCSMGDPCPPGMDCIAGTHCAWPVAPPPPPGFGDCLSDPMACLPEEDCLVDGMMPTLGVCADVTCMDAMDCPEAPPGGTAPVACDPLIGDGDGDCYLDCSMGGMCPPGMNCFGGLICAWPAP